MSEYVQLEGTDRIEGKFAIPLHGQRLALACSEEGCGWRAFGDPEARCPRHPRKTGVQRNRPYFGQPVGTRRVEGLKFLENTPK